MSFDKINRELIWDCILPELTGLKAIYSKLFMAHVTPSDKRLTLGEKRNAKPMATVASVYTIDLQYNDYLKAGLPIATGVKNGACRHLIKDRMDLTGARWSLMGADTKLRSKVQLSLPPISLSPYLPISPSPYLPISLSNQSTLFECNSV
ncbi:hypothetical protein BJP34_15570 [Moorena producens PAL-8-15-08-1]|uniref:Uncharacterized protein n=1 Tax=Moorena producens PAL-8-15-08-1 TaxID=1458985 RepID=A0A1D8TSW2_9CYAN|nr:hypothetical protein [Moorena producens]AOX00675.1 hypothetical protein BJP34_15570 [Moorena producens PAL-8-15-08-1]